MTLFLALALYGSLARLGSGVDPLLPILLAGGASARGAPGPGEPSIDGSAAPLAFGAAARRMHFAWRADGAGFEGGHSTYGARATASGVAVTPVVHRREGAKMSVARGAPLTVETVSISRGGEVLRQDDPSGRVEEDGHVSIQRGSCVERLRNTEDGVEQSWFFKRRPGGRGDLVVRLRASGQDYAGETPKGLHFKDSRTDLGVRYGHAIWIDALGERTDVRARYVDGYIELRVPEPVVAAADYPAVLDPILGPELGVGVPVIGIDPMTQDFPAIACGPETCLAVWSDNRAGWMAVRGARVTHAGELIDEKGFTLSQLITNSGWIVPAVTLGNDGYLVLWNEPHAGGYETRGALVSTSAAGSSPVLKSGILIPTEKTGTEPRSLAVAFESATQSYLVAWDNALAAGSGSPIGGVGALRMSFMGVAIEFGEQFMITASSPFVVEPAVACGGAGCMVAWRDDQSSTISAAMVDPQNVGASFPVSSGASNFSRASIALDGTGYFVVWDHEAPPESDIHVSGAHVDQSGFVDIPATKIGEGIIPRVAFNSTAQLHVVVRKSKPWSDGPEIVAVTVKGISGVLEVTDPVALLGYAFLSSQGSPHVACTDATCVVVWPAGSDIYGRAVEVSQPGSLPVGPLQLLSVSPIAQRTPAVAFDPDRNRFMMVWKEDPLSLAGSLGSIHRATLEPGDAKHVDIGSLAENAHFIAQPAISYGNKGYFVSWFGIDPVQYTFAVFGGFLTADGAVDSEKGTIVFESFSYDGQVGYPAVSSNGSGYLVAWNGWSSTGGYVNTRVAGVSASGQLLEGSGTSIAEGEGGIGRPAIAYDGDSYLVVWDGYGWIRAVRVSTEGGAVKVLDTPVNIYSKATAAWLPAASAVAYGGESYLVVWQGSPTGALDDKRIFGTRVSKHGVRLDDGFEISQKDELSDAGYPAVTFDGSHYLVLWQDAAAGGPSLRGAWVGRDGSVFPTQVGDSSTPASYEAPALASDGAGRSLLAYSRMHFEDEAGDRFDVERIRVRSAVNSCMVEAPPECSSECMLPGTCDPETLKCVASVPKPNGVVCEGGLCISGICVKGDSAGSSSQGGAGASGSNFPAEDAAGCSCTTAGSRSRGHEALGALALLFAAAVRRRSQMQQAHITPGAAPATYPAGVVPGGPVR